MSEEGIVYVLSNEAMPGLVKIGRTTRADLQARMNELYTTSIPVPFNCEYACRVKDCQKVESALHQAFSTDRVNPSREFFRTSPERIIPMLKLVEVENVTSTVQTDMNKNISSTDIQAADTLRKKKRPQLNFTEMNIPVGSELIMPFEDKEYKVIVTGPRKVSYEEEEYYISVLTGKIMGSDWNVQPCPHWFYNGKSLQDIYDETYSNLDE